MGYVYVTGCCGCCQSVFNFNPLRVPSHKLGTIYKQPICEACMTLVNEKRKAAGLEPFEIAADAYEPIDERELP
jgi:hypothetical protein